MTQASALKDDGALWTLAERTQGQTPVRETEKAALHDIGDGIACLEIKTRMNTFDDEVFSFIARALDTVKQDFSALIIGDDDNHFSAGLDLKKTLALITDENWKEISRLIRRGQTTAMALKNAPFPVVTAVAGYGVGGGCEMILHADAAQLHKDAQVGLVEQKIGVVPSWGGCKEMLLRAKKTGKSAAEITESCIKIFKTLSAAHTSGSAQEAIETFHLSQAQITSSRAALFPEAKLFAQRLSESYAPPETPVLSLPSKAIHERLNGIIDQRYEDGDIDDFTRRLQRHLAGVLSGGGLHEEIADGLTIDPLSFDDTDDETCFDLSEQDILDREHDAFMALIKTPESRNRIKTVLKQKD